MIKYFHELTKKEFKELVKKKYTWGRLEKDYPQPTWCNYPEATRGLMGCWSLVDFRIKKEKHCKNCDCYKQETT